MTSSWFLWCVFWNSSSMFACHYTDATYVLMIWCHRGYKHVNQLRYTSLSSRPRFDREQSYITNFQYSYCLNADMIRCKHTYDWHYNDMQSNRANVCFIWTWLYVIIRRKLQLYGKTKYGCMYIQVFLVQDTYMHRLYICTGSRHCCLCGE